MKINVEFDSIKEMDSWIERMGQPVQVQQKYSIVQGDTEGMKDPNGVVEPAEKEAKEEKPKATRKRKASKPKVVKDEPKVEEKEEAPQVPSTESPYIEDERPAEEVDVPTEQEAHESQAEPEETTGTPISIKSNPELVGFLQSIFGASGNDEVKVALTAFDGGLPAYIDKNLDTYKDVTTREGALEVLKSSLGV